MEAAGDKDGIIRPQALMEIISQVVLQSRQVMHWLYTRAEEVEEVGAQEVGAEAAGMEEVEGAPKVTQAEVGAEARLYSTTAHLYSTLAEDKADLDIRAPRQILRTEVGADPMWVAAEGPAHSPTEPQDQVIKEGQAEAVEGTTEGMEGMEAWAEAKAPTPSLEEGEEVMVQVEEAMVAQEDRMVGMVEEAMVAPEVTPVVAAAPPEKLAVAAEVEAR